MYNIDKAEFGRFIAQLRKEKGCTQKELAEKLFISDKAVSKWETGASIPDTALLMPLAEILGVSVTELLMCKRMENVEDIDSQQIEDIVKTAVSYSKQKPPRAYQESKKFLFFFFISAVISILGIFIWHKSGLKSTTLLSTAGISAVFGFYFCFFVKTKLPDYYSSNSLSFYYDGPVRMNIPGLTFTNSNWPYIVLTIRIWSCLYVALYPLITLLLASLVPEFWNHYELYVCLVCILGGLLIPIYIVGKKFE